MSDQDFQKPVLSKISFPGKIHLIQNDDDLQSNEANLKAIRDFGFDTETKPSFKKGDIFKVALLQLSSETDAYVIRLHRITKFQILIDLLENQEVLKVGVAIRDDIKQLQKLFSFTPQNFVELQNVAKENGLKNFGLKGMTAEVLQGELSKGAKMTNWENPVLTNSQLLYAATDAWIGLKLYQKIQVLKLS